jgi:hypothetical protein
MEQSPSWEVVKKILRLLWTPKVHHRVHKSPPLVPILSHTHPVHNFPSHFPNIHSNNIIFLSMPRGPTQPPIQWVPGALSLGVKRPGHETDHSHPSSAKVKELVVLCLHSNNTLSWRGAQLKHRDNFTFTLPSPLCLGLPSDLFPSGFPFKILYAFLISPIHSTCPPISSSLTLSPYLIIFGEEYKLTKRQSTS